jgi:hypothetical protein
VLTFKTILFFSFLAFIHAVGFAQINHSQVIRGKVVDKASQLALPGANIVLLNSQPFYGTASDINGNFRLGKVPLGRQSIRVSYIGYKDETISNLEITSGKEIVLTVGLEERVMNTKEVVIRPEKRKDLPINRMAVVSARSFTVDETERYAGSVGDPSRMAANYAGVSSLSDQQNEIVIRGNSPMGLLWRLDGVDIPNPNHFASLGTTGGGISIINNNVLANSDFLTGAFPAEYGNAMSGVFDLKTRNGNDEKYEFTAQAGFNGLELGSEGPLSRKKRSSYLVDYRYSMLVLLDKIIGADKLSVEAVPQYHDLSFKLNFPGKRLGRFSITGMGGISGINEKESTKDPSDWADSFEGSDYKFGSRMGTLIGSHMFFFNTKTWIENHISLSYVNSMITEDTFTVINNLPIPHIRQNSWESTLQFSSDVHKKINPKNRVDAGINYKLIFYKYMDKAVMNGDSFEPLIDVQGDFSFIKGYLQWQYKFTDALAFNTGVNTLFFDNNKTFSVDPRLSLRWQITPRQSFSFGTGIHSQLPEEMFYLVETTLPDSTVMLTNSDLRFMKSLHVILGYDFLINDNLRLKVETYYQYLYDIPVRSCEPAFSMLNFGSDSFSSLPVIDSLINKGTGTNYGLELTLERFLHNGLYFLVTTSLFESNYKGYDQLNHHTAFDNNFILNLLIGKEFKIKEKNFLSFDIKATWAGGYRYVPFYTVKMGDHYYVKVDEWDQAYVKRLPDYFKVNLRVGYKINFKKATAELAVDFLNLTNRKNIYFNFYDPGTGRIKTVYQLPFLPVPLIRVQF